MNSRRNLIRSLDRAKIRHSAAVANFLLDRLAYIHKRKTGERGFWLTKKTLPFKDNTYPVSELTSNLETGGFIVRASDTGQQRYYLFPTQKLERYYHDYVTANTARIDDLAVEIEHLKHETSAIWEAIKAIQNSDPPVTEEKLTRHLFSLTLK